MSVKRERGRPRKVIPSDVVRHWKAARLTNPNYSKRLLAKCFSVDLKTIWKILKQSVQDGDLPPDTFKSFPPKKGE